MTTTFTEQQFRTFPMVEKAAIFAEKVLGFAWWLDPDGSRYLVSPEDEKHVAKFTRKADGIERIAKDYYRDVPRYWSDPSEMQAALKRFCYQVPDTIMRRVEVRWFPGDAAASVQCTIVDFHPTKYTQEATWTGYGSSPEEATGIACLKVVGFIA